MSTQTTNLNLTLPAGTENVSRQIINNNMNLIDAFAGNVNTKLAQNPVLLLDTDYTLTTSEKSFSCAWSTYKTLIISFCYYNNIVASVTVPTSEFAYTNTGRMVYFFNNTNQATVRHNGDNAVYINSSVTTNMKFKIWGI